MAVQKYKLVIMGASGVGKTVFLGSYFYAAIQQGMKKNHIVSLRKKAIKPAQELMDKLFMGAQGGTDKRVDMSFNVDSSMVVQLSDLPGGYTTDVDQWLAQGVKEDLQTADGVIFFISADDLLHDYYKCVKDVFPFTTAISQYVRMTKGDAPDKRADVPIYFIFTKSDLIKNDRDENGKPYTAQKLLAMTQGLKTATKVGEKSMFFRKGQYDRAYLTCALGDWLDANTPPRREDYAPQNVIEPMEDIFEAMQDARSKHTRTKTSLKTIAAIACGITLFVGIVGLDWGVQYTRWGKTEKSVGLARQENRYEDAISAYEDYRRKPPILPIIPRFMLPGRDVNNRIEKLHLAHENYRFGKLQGYMRSVDLSKMPDLNKASNREAVAEIEAYLKNDNFMQLAPEDHYEKVRSFEKYFANGKMVSNAIKKYDDIQKALAKMDEIPESWRPDLLKRVSNGLDSCEQTILDEVELVKENPSEAIDLFTTASAQAQAILDNRWITDDMMRSQISSQIEKWGELAAQYWDNLASKLITSTASDSGEDAVNSLESAMMNLEGIPEDCEKRLTEVLADRYKTLVHSWTSKDPKPDSEEIRKNLALFPNMTTEARNEAHAYIREQESLKVENLYAQLNDARSLSSLNSEWQNVKTALLGTEIPDTLTNTLQEKFTVLIKEELGMKRNEIMNECLTVEEVVFDGYGMIIGYEGQISKDIAIFENLCSEETIESAKKDLDAWKKGLLIEAEKAEFRRIKNEFKGIANDNTLNKNLSEMKEFLVRYKTSGNLRDVQQAISYLEKISGGCKATLTIKKAFVDSDERGWHANARTLTHLWEQHFADPTLLVQIKSPFSAQTKSYKAKDRMIEPEEDFPFEWKVDSEDFTFKIIDDRGDEKDELATVKVNCNGVTGWKKIEGEHREMSKKGNRVGMIELGLSLKEKLPDCPSW